MSELIYEVQSNGTVVRLDEETQEIVIRWDAGDYELGYSTENFSGLVTVGDRIQMTTAIAKIE